MPFNHNQSESVSLPRHLKLSTTIFSGIVNSDLFVEECNQLLQSKIKVQESILLTELVSTKKQEKLLKKIDHFLKSEKEQFAVRIKLNPKLTAISNKSSIWEFFKLFDEKTAQKKLLFTFYTKKTESKKSEKGISPFFDRISENLKEVLWIRNADNSKIIFINKTYETVWGRSRESLLSNPASFLESIYPDDYQLVLDAYKSYLINEKFDMEYRIIHSDGNYKWIHARTFPIKDKHGNTIQHIGIASDISELKNTIADKTKAEQDFRSMLNTIPIGIAKTSHDHSQIEFINDHFIELFGYKREEIPTISRWYELAYPDVTYRNNIINNTKREFKKAKKENFWNAKITSNVTCKDGSNKTVLWNGYITEGNFLISGLDVTQQQQILNSLNQRNQELHLLESLSNCLSTHQPESFICETIVNGLRKHIFENEIEYCSCTINNITYETGKRFEDSESLNYEILVNGNSIGKIVVSIDKKETDSNSLHEIRSFINTCIDRLASFYYQKEIQDLSTYHLKKIQTFSNTLPGALFGIEKTDHNGFKFSLLSESISSILKLPQKNLIEKPELFFEKIHPDDSNRIKESLFHSIKNQSVWKEEFRTSGNSAEEQWISVNAIPFLEQNNRISWSGYLHDITQEKLSLRHLKESKEKYKMMSEFLSEGVLLQRSPDDSILEANDAACRILGLSRNQLMGLDSMDPRWKSVKLDGTPMTPESHPSQITIRTKNPVRNFIMGVNKPNEDRIWILINSEPIFDDKEELQFVLVTFSEITEIINTEIALKNTSQNLKKMLDLQTCFVIKIDLEGNYTYVNRKYIDTFGYLYSDSNVTEKDLIHKSCMDSIMKDDFPKVADAVQELLQHPSKIIQVDIRKPLKSGELSYTLWDFSVVMNLDGNPSEVLCVGIDYTDRMKKEQLIMEFSKRLENTIEAIPHPLMILNENLHIEFINEEFEHVFGYGSNEVIGKTVDHLIPEKYLPNHTNLQLGYLKDGGKLKRKGKTVLAKTKSGNIIHIDANLNTFIANDKKYVIVILQDVTKDVEKQKLISDQNTNLQKIAWIQSHEIRRPLANILGLTEFLTHHFDSSMDTLEENIRLLGIEAKELDKKIREIVQLADKVQEEENKKNRL